MNYVKSSTFITFISLLILNMLLTFCGIFSYFFKITDYTLIAGIIAFVGAIIGGSITLIGVNLTIKHSDRAEVIKQLPNKVEHSELLLKKLLLVKSAIEGADYDTYEIIIIFENAKQIIDEEKVLQTSIKTSSTCYYVIKRFDEELKKVIISLKTTKARGEDLNFYMNEHFTYQEQLRKIENCIEVVKQEVFRMETEFFENHD